MLNITLANDGKGLGALDDIFSKVSHVYFKASALSTFPTGNDAAIAVDFELPIIDGSVSFDTGGIDKTEVKLTTGQIWTSKATKSDSAITMQIASLDADIAALFLSSVTGTNGKGYALDVKKTVGTLIFTDESGNGMIILPKAEMYGSLVVGEGDNPSYFNVSVTPLLNAEGASIYIDTAEAN